MGITVIWDDEAHTTLRYVYEGRWTWEDFNAARVMARTMLGSVTHKVDIIVDVRKSSLLPSGVITRARQLALSSPTTSANEGMTVIVGANAFIRSIFETFQRLYQKVAGKVQIRFTATLDEAHAILAHQRSQS